MAAKTAGEKRAEARQRNREMRECLEEMTNQQLRNFFGGFDVDMIERFDDTLERVKAEQAEEEIKRIDDQISTLKQQQADLKRLTK